MRDYVCNNVIKVRLIIFFLFTTYKRSAHFLLNAVELYNKNYITQRERSMPLIFFLIFFCMEMEGKYNFSPGKNSRRKKGNYTRKGKT